MHVKNHVIKTILDGYGEGFDQVKANIKNLGKTERAAFKALLDVYKPNESYGEVRLPLIVDSKMLEKLRKNPTDTSSCGINLGKLKIGKKSSSKLAEEVINIKEVQNLRLYIRDQAVPRDLEKIANFYKKLGRSTIKIMASFQKLQSELMMVTFLSSSKNKTLPASSVRVLESFTNSLKEFSSIINSIKNEPFITTKHYNTLDAMSKSLNQFATDLKKQKFNKLDAVFSKLNEASNKNNQAFKQLFSFIKEEYPNGIEEMTQAFQRDQESERGPQSESI